MLKSLNTGVNVSAQPSIKGYWLVDRDGYKRRARSAHAAVDFAWALRCTPA